VHRLLKDSRAPAKCSGETDRVLAHRKMTKLLHDRDTAPDAARSVRIFRRAGKSYSPSAETAAYFSIDCLDRPRNRHRPVKIQITLEDAGPPCCAHKSRSVSHPGLWSNQARHQRRADFTCMDIGRLSSGVYHGAWKSALEPDQRANSRRGQLRG